MVCAWLKAIHILEYVYVLWCHQIFLICCSTFERQQNFPRFILDTKNPFPPQQW